MFLHFLAQATSAATNQDPSIIGLITTVGTAALASGGAITITLGNLFDTKRIQKIVQLEGKIENLQWRLTHQEEESAKKEAELAKKEAELAKLNSEIEELERQIDALREQSNSSMNTQLLDLREKYENLYATHIKAVKIIKQLKGEKS